MRSRLPGIAPLVRLACLVSGLTALEGVALAAPASGQLLSPGPLGEAHAELEGIRQCTQCHELGTRGISAARCLACHEALAVRIEEDLGYHATVADQGCADCHQDHLGRDFDILHLDIEAFDHADAGYELLLSHEAVDCRQCHTPDNIADPSVRAFKLERGSLEDTYLGLAADCSSCHESESPHGAQFADRTCADCHDEAIWEEAPRFDHGRTDYPLTGLHADVSCAACHGSGDTAVYEPVEHTSCASCHDDPHAGAMQGSCSTCHQTGGWTLLAADAVDSGFDHSRTSFGLVGAHAQAECAACHVRGRPPRTELLHLTYVPGTTNRTYPTPIAESCASCHVDRHVLSGTTGRWLECASCHAEGGWSPSAFDVQRHQQESTFPLTGAHVTTPCFLCHVDPDAGDRFLLAVDGGACVTCHVDDDPHDGIYDALSCETCHVTDDFLDVAYTHPEADLADRSCVSCHEPQDPHAGQFQDRDCAECHQTEQFTIDAFDHSTTRYPLDGAHDQVPCASCHLVEQVGSPTMVRYSPLGTECSDCHGGRPDA